MQRKTSSKVDMKVSILPECVMVKYAFSLDIRGSIFRPSIPTLSGSGLNDGFSHGSISDSYSDSRPDHASTSSNEFSRSPRNLSSPRLGIVAPAAIACPPPTPLYFGDRFWRIFPRFTPFWTSCSVALVETFASPDLVRVVTTVTFDSPNSFDEEISEETAPVMLSSIVPCPLTITTFFPVLVALGAVATQFMYFESWVLYSE